MIENGGKNLKINLMRIQQNPSQHVVVECKKTLDTLGIDHHDENSWIKFEDKFKIEHFSYLDGAALYELVLMMTILNSQGGKSSIYMEKLSFIPRNIILYLYYKYLPIRKKSLSINAYQKTVFWLKENGYMSELEMQRLLGYKVNYEVSTSLLDDFNHNLMKYEIINYVKKYYPNKE